MTDVVRMDPPSWWKLPVWVGLVAVAALAAVVSWMAFLMWPWPTCTVLALVVGFAAGMMWGRRPLPDIELVHKRKDLAIDAAMGTAFQLQRLSGEHPVQVGDEFDPEPWQHDGEHAITERCESCDAPGQVRLADESVLCRSCESAAGMHTNPPVDDDTATGTLAYPHSGEWAPAAPGRAEL